MDMRTWELVAYVTIGFILLAGIALIVLEVVTNHADDLEDEHEDAGVG